MDNSNPSTPGQPGSEQTATVWPLPFPLPPGGEWLEVEQQDGGSHVVYRWGNIALRTLDGVVVGVCIYKVWLMPSDVYAFWQVMAAAVRAGATMRPGRRTDGFVVPLPDTPVTAKRLREDATRKPRLRIGIRYRCGQVQLTLRTSPQRHASLNAFGVRDLDPAAVLRDLPAVLAVLSAEV